MSIDLLYHLLNSSFKYFSYEETKRRKEKYIQTIKPQEPGYKKNLFALQVLSLLPPYKGKSILELGAGIGRFTGELAKEADQVVALDFIEGAIMKVTFSH